MRGGYVKRALQWALVESWPLQTRRAPVPRRQRRRSDVRAAFCRTASGRATAVLFRGSRVAHWVKDHRGIVRLRFEVGVSLCCAKFSHHCVRSRLVHCFFSVRVRDDHCERFDQVRVDTIAK